MITPEAAASFLKVLPEAMKSLSEEQKKQVMDMFNPNIDELAQEITKINLAEKIDGDSKN